MIFWTIGFLIVAPFGFILLHGAPYLPTRRQQANNALDLLGLSEGDVFVDLGSGDGSVLIEASLRGLTCYGYEMNPFMWLISIIRTHKMDNVTIKFANFWNTPLPDNTSGVFVFLLDRYMSQLDNKMRSESQRGCKLASYTFLIPEKEPIKSKNAIHIYKY